MKQVYTARNEVDPQGNPAGGWAEAMGLRVRWQDGPLGRGGERFEPNGAFVETLIDVAKQRIEFYQRSDFACGENAEAIALLEAALAALESRTQRRERLGVEGTHAV